MSGSNPYSPLLRMIELRIKRQEIALTESKLQYDATKVAFAEYEAGDRSQPSLDLGAAGGAAKKR